jgi:hypothetical protein
VGARRTLESGSAAGDAPTEPIIHRQWPHTDQAHAKCGARSRRHDVHGSGNHTARRGANTDDQQFGAAARVASTCSWASPAKPSASDRLVEARVSEAQPTIRWGWLIRPRNGLLVVVHAFTSSCAVFQRAAASAQEPPGIRAVTQVIGRPARAGPVGLPGPDAARSFWFRRWCPYRRRRHSRAHRGPTTRLRACLRGCFRRGEVRGVAARRHRQLGSRRTGAITTARPEAAPAATEPRVIASQVPIPVAAEVVVKVAPHAPSVRNKAHTATVVSHMNSLDRCGSSSVGSIGIRKTADRCTGSASRWMRAVRVVHLSCRPVRCRGPPVPGRLGGACVVVRVEHPGPDFSGWEAVSRRLACRLLYPAK